MSDIAVDLLMDALGDIMIDDLTNIGADVSVDANVNVFAGVMTAFEFATPDRFEKFRC